MNLKDTQCRKFKAALTSALLYSLLVIGCVSNSKESPKPFVMDNTVSTVKPASPPANFTHRFATVNGIKIHYVIGGKGAPLLLLHGFGENWYVWNRLLPEFSKHFTVIVPDLIGVGESDKPATGYDKKTMAQEMHGLIAQLGYKDIFLTGHDIGLMVAYAYAAQYGSEVKKLALMDAPLPGVEPYWKDISKQKWHFGFFSRPIAADLVNGHQLEFFNDFWGMEFGENKHPFYKEEIAEFVRCYSTKGAMEGSLNWYKNFSRDAVDNQVFMKHKLQMPVLAIGGQYAMGPILTEHIRSVAVNVKGVEIRGSGHWLVQEQTEQVQKALLQFLTD